MLGIIPQCCKLAKVAGVERIGLLFTTYSSSQSSKHTFLNKSEAQISSVLLLQCQSHNRGCHSKAFMGRCDPRGIDFTHVFECLGF